MLTSSFENAGFFDRAKQTLSRGGPRWRSKSDISTAEHIVPAVQIGAGRNKYGSKVDEFQHTGKIGRIVNGLSDVTVKTNLRNKTLNFNGVLMGDSRAQQLSSDIRSHITRMCRQQARLVVHTSPSTRTRRPPTRHTAREMEPIRVIILKHNRYMHVPFEHVFMYFF